jgi:hypothetical protein
MWTKIMTFALAIAAGLCALHFLAIWVERRGWIHYRKRRFSDSTSRGGGMRGVLGQFQEFVQPEIRHVWEDQDRRSTQIKSTRASDE